MWSKSPSRILQQVPGVTAIQSPDLFQAFRKQMTGLQQGMLFILSIILVMSLLLIGLIFLMATNERRREIGVLRALGATRAAVFRSLLAEAAILALGGGLTGIVLAALAIYLFRNLIVTSVGFPFLFPSLLDLLPLALGGLAVVLLGHHDRGADPRAARQPAGSGAGHEGVIRCWYLCKRCRRLIPSLPGTRSTPCAT